MQVRRFAFRHRDAVHVHADQYRNVIDASRPIACIPLKIGTRVIGVVAIYRLLQQKEHFGPLDFELFTLLAGHAATALFSSKLYQKSEKKLSELQGFLDLLTAPSPGS